MKLKLVLVVALALIALGAVVLARGAQAQEGPTSGTLVASEFSATGSAIGPDGAFYVVDAGTGGENVVQLPEEMGGGEANWGLTARIVRIDPDDGEVTDAATNLPSFESEDGAFSATDIAFNGNDLYWLLTGSVNLLGGDLEDWPNGVYEVVDWEGVGPSRVVRYPAVFGRWPRLLAAAAPPRLGEHDELLDPTRSRGQTSLDIPRAPGS